MRMAKWMLAAMTVNCLTVGLALGAIDHHAATSPASHARHTTQPDPYPHPRIADDASWVRPVVAGITILFLAAIPVGIIVRANRVQETSGTHAHDESHAHNESHGGHDPHGGHGAGGHH